ncbi:DegT/DnrJ/EryC1/StrS family aminotransferase [Hydromonas duriensis]|uniref:CDP-6-deoxy-D-xylo-4-hexulose-3-dehydrase n=1 Tax=Hydromonas duriensis TaxID=1527608 RepID=A0A4R6Y148_9BURK|nr:DegT/DnrJ/EryC1/StrS family aminotransferase [Hydromonas duriensis]TDR29062.1 CDP-6-deoxy-D-xylo-4-hexulose-3-dehydrase [Hydromonas duriensis]
MSEWKLNDSNFTWLDRLKLSTFFLNPHHMWTMSTQVKKFEALMTEYIGSQHSIFVSNGSTANTLLAMYTQDCIATPEKKTVIFPSVTWITSVSPFIRLGFTPKFIDISLDDFAMDLDLLEAYLAEHHHEVALIFVTALLGRTPNIARLKNIEEKYNVRVMMDNCEAHFSTYNDKNISSYFTSTTSTYFGHLLQSVEGGFVFTNDKAEQEYFTMSRNHGMFRTLPAEEQNKYRNPLVDDRFSFYHLGNNFRNTDLHAKVGILDFARINFYTQQRLKLYEIFKDNLSEHYILPKEFKERKNVMFCLPIISTVDGLKEHIMAYCQRNHIEMRPIISGNLLRQTALKDFGDYKDYPIAELIHQYGFYIGLHPQITKKQILTFVQYLNSLV